MHVWLWLLNVPSCGVEAYVNSNSTYKRAYNSPAVSDAVSYVLIRPSWFSEVAEDHLGLTDSNDLTLQLRK